MIPIQKQILGVAPLVSPYAQLAADVNGDQEISTGDLIAIRKLILGSTVSMPAGLWRFVRADYVFPDPQTDPNTPWDAPGSRSYSGLVADVTDGDFVAIKLGDVNNSWTAPVGRRVCWQRAPRGGGPAKNALPEVVFAVNQQSAQPGQTVSVRVTVSGFSQVSGAQFSLAWDPAVLRYVGTGDYGLQGAVSAVFWDHDDREREADVGVV